MISFAVGVLIFFSACFLSTLVIAAVVGPRAYANGRAAGYRDGLAEGGRRSNVALLRPPFKVAQR